MRHWAPVARPARTDLLEQLAVLVRALGGELLEALVQTAQRALGLGGLRALDGRQDAGEQVGPGLGPVEPPDARHHHGELLGPLRTGGGQGKADGQTSDTQVMSRDPRAKGRFDALP